MKALFALLCLLFSSLAFAATLDQCESMPSPDRDACYLANSRSADSCSKIGDVKIRDSCFVSIAEERAKTETECDALFVQYQKTCYSRLLFQRTRDRIACEDLPSDYKGECYIYYAMHLMPGQAGSCDMVPPAYREECLDRFFSKLSITNKEDCSQFPGKYGEACLAYVDRAVNVQQRFVMYLDSAFAFIGAGSTIVGTALLSIFLVLLALVAMFLLGKRKKKKSQ